MRTLSNNRGISLIILVIAMTLIAILGASFVSLVGTKHKGFLYQRDSYRSLNLANAGVEYAIRCISDSLKNTSNTYFQDPTVFQTSSNPVVVNMSANQSFSFFYKYSNDVLSVSGSFGDSKRQISIKNFRRYIDCLTFQYDPGVPLSTRRPYYSSGSIRIPIFNNNNLDIHISGINIVMPTSGKYLQGMYFTETSETLTYNYVSDLSFSNCGMSVPLPCRDTVDWWGLSKTGIRLPSGSTSFTFTSNSPHAIPGNTASVFRLLFDLPDTFTGYVYSITFRYRIGVETTDRTTTLTFRL